MAAYILADVTITDPERMAVYREWSTRAMQEHGAEVLIRGGEPEALEGPWAPERVVLLRFKSREAARTFYDGESYRHARTLREGAGAVRAVLLDGI